MGESQGMIHPGQIALSCCELVKSSHLCTSKIQCGTGTLKGKKLSL